MHVENQRLREPRELVSIVESNDAFRMWKKLHNRNLEQSNKTLRFGCSKQRCVSGEMSVNILIKTLMFHFLCGKVKRKEVELCYL